MRLLAQRFIHPLGGIIPNHPLLIAKLDFSRRLALGVAESGAIWVSLHLVFSTIATLQFCSATYTNGFFWQGASPLPNPVEGLSFDKLRTGCSSNSPKAKVCSNHCTDWLPRPLATSKTKFFRSSSHFYPV